MITNCHSVCNFEIFKERPNLLARKDIELISGDADNH